MSIENNIKGFLKDNGKGIPTMQQTIAFIQQNFKDDPYPYISRAINNLPLANRVYLRWSNGIPIHKFGA